MYRALILPGETVFVSFVVHGFLASRLGWLPARPQPHGTARLGSAWHGPTASLRSAALSQPLGRAGSLLISSPGKPAQEANWAGNYRLFFKVHFLKVPPALMSCAWAAGEGHGCSLLLLPGHWLCLAALPLQTPFQGCSRGFGSLCFQIVPGHLQTTCEMERRGRASPWTWSWHCPQGAHTLAQTAGICLKPGEVSSLSP